jgi:hypothetical protein
MKKKRLNICLFIIILLFSVLANAVGMPISAAHATSAVSAGDGVFTFASMGDAQSEPENFTTTLNQIAALNPDLVLRQGS